MSKANLVDQITRRLTTDKDRLRTEFNKHTIKSCYIDNLLDSVTAGQIFKAFPDPSKMALRKSLREHKYVAAQLDKYDPAIEEIVFAFQDNGIVSLLKEITGIATLYPDPNLYAGGISVMTPSNFLNPHLDNSHDKDRKNYRVLNLLYYVTPDWDESNGGNLELWDRGTRAEPRKIWSRFNRLVIMQTDKTSYHSVSKVRVPGSRCCVSNYYFSPEPPDGKKYFHVTSFRGRPEEPVTDAVLRVDAVLRNALRIIAKNGVRKIWHMYKRF